MTTPACSRCGADLGDLGGAIGVVLHGFGDAGLIDTFHGEINLTCCEACGKELLTTEAWLRPALAALNINYGHVCTDDSLHWVPMPECALDPDRHGWREVFDVRPVVPGRLGERAPLLTPAGLSVRFGTHDTLDEAEAHAMALTAQGLPARVSRKPIGNAVHGAEMDPAEWFAWWPDFNRTWLRRARLRNASGFVRTVVRHPIATAAYMVRSRRAR